jgi:hypothetical protein
MPIDFQKLDSIDLNTNTTVTGTPQYYYHFDDAVGLYPVPTEAGKTIKIYSYDQPDVPTSTSTLQIPSRFHNYLVIGVAYYMSLKELGHPHVALFERQWNSPANPHNAIRKVRNAIKLRNKDSLPTVKREEDLPSTALGAI